MYYCKCHQLKPVKIMLYNFRDKNIYDLTSMASYPDTKTSNIVAMVKLFSNYCDIIKRC